MEGPAMGQHISYGRREQTRFGYLAVPPAGKGPGVVVLQEWWGLVGHIIGAADRLAVSGYVALAPDLYRGARAGDLDGARKLALGLAMDQATIEIADASGYLARYCTDRDRIGAVGFGMGGSLALWSPALVDEVVAAVGFYPPRASIAPRWDKYEGKVAMIHTAEGDGGSFAPGVTEAVASITAAGGKAEVYDYPGTHHAFCNDEQPEVYHPVAAGLAWTRTLDLLGRELGEPA
jgi:carboxymethylenebutenolidase